MKSLMTAFKLGDMEMQNRVVMSPMTRCRATPDHVPTPVMAEYYGQRASAGLIISEGTAPSPNGAGYARQPGIYAPEHVTAWKKITDTVHAKGGKIFVQIMHTGRASHPLNLPKGARVLGPSPIAIQAKMWTDQAELQPLPVPREMSEGDIREAIEEYAQSAANAMDAGFDGIELHAANGYLLDQFLNTGANQRTDEWGGTIRNRIRFVVETAKAAVARIGGSRTGIRVSPYGNTNDMRADPEMDALYVALCDALSPLGLAYIHIADHSSMGSPIVKQEIKDLIRRHFNGAVILSGGYDATRAESDLAAGRGDLIAFGRPFISNPDLPHRLFNGIALSPSDRNTFYGGGTTGYIDYPSASTG